MNRRKWIAAVLCAAGVAVAAGPTAAAPEARGTVGAATAEAAIVTTWRRAQNAVVRTQLVVLSAAMAHAGSAGAPGAAGIGGAYVTVLRCPRPRGGCVGRVARAYRLGEGDFTIDPLLRTARLDVGEGRRALVVEWEGTSEPTLGIESPIRRKTGDPAAGSVWWEAEAAPSVTSSRRTAVRVLAGGDLLGRHDRRESWLLRLAGGAAAQSACFVDGSVLC